MGRGSHDALHLTVHGYPPPPDVGPHCTAPAPTPNDIEWLLKHVRRQAVGTHPTGMLSCLSCTWNITGFPLGLENLQKWEGIFQSGKSQGILNRLEKSGQEFQTNIICYFSVIFK